MKGKGLFAIISVLLIVGALGLTYYFLNRGETKTEENKQTDGEKFAEEYKEASTIGEDNVFTYVSADEVIKIMENGTGVVYLGYPECPWCGAYVVYLNEVAKDVGIDEIYYYNVKEARANNTEEYQRMVEILGDNLEYDEKGNHRIYVPNVSFHVEGKIVGNDFESAYDTKGFDDPVDYWNEDAIFNLKARLNLYMTEVYTALNSCSECNE